MLILCSFYEPRTARPVGLAVGPGQPSGMANRLALASRAGRPTGWPGPARRDGQPPACRPAGPVGQPGWPLLAGPVGQPVGPGPGQRAGYRPVCQLFGACRPGGMANQLAPAPADWPAWPVGQPVGPRRLGEMANVGPGRPAGRASWPSRPAGRAEWPTGWPRPAGRQGQQTGAPGGRLGQLANWLAPAGRAGWPTG